jgi:hypothetical protein
MEKYFQQYANYCILENREPVSIGEFCRASEIDAEEFLKHFKSVEELRNGLLNSCIENLHIRLSGDKEFQEFSFREKLMTYYFGLFESLLPYRTYLIQRYKSWKKVPDRQNEWRKFYKLHVDYIDQLIQAACATGELQRRNGLEAYSAKGFQLVFTYLLRVWMNDESQDFTTTDAAIEKSIHLSVSLLEPSSLDALVDFGKFAFSTKV